MIFSFLTFEIYFPFAIKGKTETVANNSDQEQNDDEFVSLSRLLKHELRLDADAFFEKNQANGKKMCEQSGKNRDQAQLENNEKYFYFLLRWLLKKKTTNPRSPQFLLEEVIFSEIQKSIRTIKNDNVASSKSQISVLRKNFEFQILDYYYQRETLIQYIFQILWLISLILE